MTRFVPVTVLMMVLAASGTTRAQTLPNGATLTFDKLYIHENGGAYQEPSDPDARRYYFNLAHCVCSKANAGMETTFQYLLTLSQVTGKDLPAQLWVGTTCDMTPSRTPPAATCRMIQAIPDVDQIAKMETRLEFSIYDVIAGVNNTAACPTDAASGEIDKALWLLIDTTGSGTPDYSLVKNVGQPPGDMAVGIDTAPPPPVTGFSAKPSDGGIALSWTLPTSRANDVYYYQALCAKADGTPVRTNPPQARYRTAGQLCGRPQDDPMLVPSDPGVAADVDASAGAALPPGLATLDPAFICGETMSGAANGMSIDGLENGVPYNVVLLAADLHGNYSGTYFTTTITPKPATDFWEDLHDRGSKTEGGFCLLAETYGDGSGLTNTLRAFRDDTLGGSHVGRWLTDVYYATLAKLGAYVHGSVALRIVAGVVLAPVVVFVLLWHWLTLPGVLGLMAAAWWWRRRRRGVVSGWGRRLLRMRVVRVAVGISVIALGASRAHAGGNQPYWEDGDPTSNENQATVDVPGIVTWHAGIRIGPYVPDIDKQFGMTPGPYQQMYGGYQILPILDVDRILWTGFGQLGVGGSAGYMQKSGHSFVDGSDPNDPKRPRSEGDINTFRLIPLALTATYRFTWFDDKYGIPVVPYVRGGLSYYVWWVSAKGDGVCKDGMIAEKEPGCSLDKPRGASLGAQGSIGLAIRAERIDASAAVSMRQSGIEHAGIYAELSLAKVDGFGSDTKLSVGDRTWFAGVDFEF